MIDTWTVAGRTFRSRLIVGTGKYKDFAENAAALEASGAEIVTVAVRRVNISDPKAPMLTDFIDPKKITYLPNTAGCFTADDAIRTLRLAREAGGWDLVKLEVLGEARTLYPDMRETLKATEVLAKEGFLPMVYCVDDPIAAKQLESAGAVAVMPLGAPIGSGLGIQNRVTIRLIVEGASVPVLVDAGVGTAIGRGSGDGAGLRRGADEHRDRRSEGPGPHGPGDETRGRGRPSRLSLRAHGDAQVCRSFEPACRTDLRSRSNQPHEISIGGSFVSCVSRYIRFDCACATSSRSNGSRWCSGSRSTAAACSGPTSDQFEIGCAHFGQRCVSGHRHVVRPRATAAA